MTFHTQVSAVWLGNRLRATAARIRSIPVSWFTPDRIAAQLEVLADELAAVMVYPPPTDGSVASFPVPPAPTGAPPPIALPPDPARELADVLTDVKMALERQPYEPTVADLIEVLEARLRTGSVPMRSISADPSWGDGDTCLGLCPLCDAVEHHHGLGRIFWS